MITAMPRIAIATTDFAGAVATFRNVFGLPVLDISETSVASLGAELAMCVPAGGSNIELMSPANPGAPLSQSLSRFLTRRGDGLFALMLEAPVPNDEAEVLSARGLNVLPLMPGAAGRDVHPKSTHGVLIRIYPDHSFEGTLAESDASLGLSGIRRVMIAVADLDAAARLYGDGLGLALDPATTDPERGVGSVLCHPPRGGAIELVTPLDAATPLADAVRSQLQTAGEGMFALVLGAADVDAAAAALAERGLIIDRVRDDRVATRAFGARIVVAAEPG